MKRVRLLSSLFPVFAILFASVVLAQETSPPSNDQEDEGVKIFNYYKDCLVDIQTTLVPAVTMADGSSGGNSVHAEAYTMLKGYLVSGGHLYIDEFNNVYPYRASRHASEITLADNGAIQFGGSGSFIDGAGNILTAAHVIRLVNDELNVGFAGKIKIASYSYYVTCHGLQKKYPAIFKGADYAVDAGILQAVGAKSESYRVANCGNSHDVRVGERVYALGFPHGLPPTLTSGIVSNVNVFIGMNYVEDFIQTDAPINPGNSGGPLVNSRGELIAINTAGFRGSDGLGFAVPLHIIDLERLKVGDVSVNWFGLEAMLEYFARTGDPGDPGFQDVKRFNEETGIENLKALMLLANLTNEKKIEDGNNQNVWAVVNYIDENLDADGKMSPAKEKGFSKGDLIVKVNDRLIRSGMDIRLAVRATPTGMPFEVEFVRTDNGEKTVHKVIVELRKKKE